MKVLITGGAGFIGSHLADRLLAEGAKVRALDNLDPQVHPGSGRPEYLDESVELVVGDVRDRGALRSALDGIDTVVHFAGTATVFVVVDHCASECIGVHAAKPGTRFEAVEPLRQGIRALFGEYERGIAPGLRPEMQLAARQWDVLGDDGQPLEPEPTAETKPLRPTSIYAINKRDHEEMVLAVGAAYGIPSVALRFFNVYGERQALSNPYTGVAAIFASRVLNDRPPLIFEDGNQTRDFIDVRDIARACSLAITSDRADGRTLNLGTGVPTSVREVAAVIAHGLGKDIEPEVVNQYRAGDIRHCYADTRLAEELLGFRAEIPFELGMEDLLAWLEGQEAADTVDAAREALVARGLAR